MFLCPNLYFCLTKQANTVKEDYHRWHSYRIRKEFDMLTFGHTGKPLIIFPTSYNRYFEAKDRGLIGSIQWLINEGRVKVYCPDSLDSENWYNQSLHPSDRVRSYEAYEELILQEVVPRAMYETGHDKILVAGCSFGGYHAANFAFRHPEKVASLISMGAKFDIRSFLDGFYNEGAYYQNPVDYMSNIGEGDQLRHIRNMGIVLGAGEHDICKDANIQFAHILRSKGIQHWLDIQPNHIHDWPAWLQVFPYYLGKVV